MPALQAAFNDPFRHNLGTTAMAYQGTCPEFERDVTINVFPFLKISGKGPEQTATAIGEFLQREVPIVERSNVVYGTFGVCWQRCFWVVGRR